MKEHSVSGTPPQLFLTKAVSDRIKFRGEPNKTYVALSSLSMVLMPETRYFHDKEYRSSFLSLGFFSFLVKREQYVLCSVKLEKPIEFKTVPAGGRWFATSGVGYEFNALDTVDMYTKEKDIAKDEAKYRNILTIGAIEDYPLELSLVKGTSCNDKVFKTFILDYYVEKDALGQEVGTLETKERK